MTTNEEAPRDSALRTAISHALEVAMDRPPSPSGSERARTRRASQAIRERREAEYHQARVLLLISALAGRSGSLFGLTKLAKLDFLLRYPVFLERLADDGVDGLFLDDLTRPTQEERQSVESRMLRYKYGPWDDRYYSIVGALVGRGLVEYVPSRGGLALRPTAGGRALAKTLAADHAWRRTAMRCDALRVAFGKLSGNSIKELIYKHLPDVVDRPHWTEI